ncbi:MAG: SGNH/GDSL hydrolase family protein [Caulobacteraceae bacterium]
MRIRALLVIAFAVLTGGSAPPPPPFPHWVATWASAQWALLPRDVPPPADMEDVTLRQIVRLSIGGERFRFRLSNAFGAAPLVIDAIHVARSAGPGSPRLAAGSDRVVTFNGRTAVMIPAGADYLSDVVDLPAPALSSLAISLHLPHRPDQQTGHADSRTTTYLVHGDRTAARDLPGAGSVTHWYNLSEVDVQGQAHAKAIIAFGDSITDGVTATLDGADRWPDVLAGRLQAAPGSRLVAVINQGFGGNHLLTDGLGVNALARFDRDVLSPPGVEAVILLEGINDLGKLTFDHPVSADEHKAFVEQVLGAYRQMIERAHAHGIRMIGATITPYGGDHYYHPDAPDEQDRQTINQWIRAPGHFDGVVDFDLAVRDPDNPTHLLAAYDSGDHLHPSVAGFKAMGDAIPLSLVGR